SVCLRCGMPTTLTVASTFRVSVIPSVMREVGALLVLPVGVGWPVYFALMFLFRTPPLELVLLQPVVSAHASRSRASWGIWSRTDCWAS
ncbi:MAG TPA: hypothetical protein VKD72_00965, partial [Gemmataceae bacterium]|nr:hypothetical protein [Gemmataceae bacterium]